MPLGDHFDGANYSVRFNRRGNNRVKAASHTFRTLRVRSHGIPMIGTRVRVTGDERRQREEICVRVSGSYGPRGASASILRASIR